MSTAQLPTSTVAAACARYLADRRANIDARREKLIEEHTRPWWRRLLGMRPRTRDEAMRAAGAGDTWSEYNMLNLYAGADAGRVNDLCALTKAAMKARNGQISVSALDAAILREYL